MKKINSKGKLFLYALSGMGVNMLNLIIGSYLCDALMVEGFEKNVANWTYLDKTLVVAVVWSIFVTVSKIIDGLVDIPLASFTDNLKTKWGKRRPAILMGFVPMLIMYCLFLLPISTDEKSLANTIWFGVILCLFYIFYTLTMVTYYATFSEVVDNDKDRLILSNYKSFFDIIYFVLGYALIPLLVGSMNIRIVALIFLPLSLTMLIPLFMLKEESTKECDVLARRKVVEKLAAENKITKEELIEEKEQPVKFIESIKYTFKNKNFIVWMLVYSFLSFGLQMFLTGQNVYDSGTLGFEGWQITVVMASSFALVPLMLFLFNKVVNKKGFKFGYQYCVLSFIIGMAFYGLCRQDIITNLYLRLALIIVGGIFCSVGIGTFFSVSYIVPSQLASDEAKRTGKCNSAMYFAVQGLVAGIATAISTGIVWVNLKSNNLTDWMPEFVIGACLISFILSFILPHSVSNIGKKVS
ncbi:MAG: MFS transporter [Bacilli bacterium]